MRLKYPFETLELDDEIVAVPVGDDAQEFHGVLRLNESASVILALLAEDTDEEQVVKTLSAEYDGTEPAQLATYVHDFVETLKSEGLMLE